MTEKQMARNCDRCRTRKVQFLCMGWKFDYKNCPYVCTRNGLFHKLNIKGVSYEHNEN